MTRNWTPSSWQSMPAVQQPQWPDTGELERALKQISTFPPLVFAGEARSLQAALGQVASGNAFLLQAGDCAESFEEFTAVNIREKLRVILQMDLNRVHAWNQEFVATSAEGQRYEQVAAEIERALAFMRACGVDTETHSALHQVDVYTSHEALILGYEEALTRQDSLTGGWYDCSAHMLWIGERTRQLDGAHIEFLRGVGNPIGCKIGKETSVDFVLNLCETLNPSRIPGRLTLITRMGADNVEETLRPLLRAVRDTGHPVVWACDPMHANTFTAPNGRKTRHFDDIIREITGFVLAHRAEGTWPGGIHIELTGDNVTECLGGAEAVSNDDLDTRYETVCDPRLNARQSLDLAFRVAELIRDKN